MKKTICKIGVKTMLSLFVTLQIFPQSSFTPIGSGTYNYPYLIATLDELYWISQNDTVWNKHFKQTANINAAPTSGWTSGGWTPIGNLSAPFTGSFNGQGFSIDSLYINRSATENQGLFGVTSDGSVIDSVELTNISIVGKYYVGGLVGGHDGGTINNSRTSGNVNGTGYVGGLVGYHYGIINNCNATTSVGGTNSIGGLVGINSGTIDNSYSIGNVSGTQYVGGLIGYHYVAVNNSYATGNVNGHNNVGGLVGRSENGSISRSYSTGSVSGYTALGGLLGINNGGTLNNTYSTGSVSGTGGATGGLIGYDAGGSVGNSYATGYVSGIGYYDGGLVGFNDWGVINNSFWDTQTTGRPWSAGGMGKTTVEMKDKSTFLLVGWQDSIWNIGDGINTGYPYLKWQNPSGTSLPVEIAFFTVKESQWAVTLRWETATETNNLGWEIERCTKIIGNDVNTWSKIGFVAGAGTTASPQGYSFTDSKLATGRYSYRMKQIDRSGMYTYTNAIEVNIGLGSQQFRCSQNYPNPFNPTTSISYSISEPSNVSMIVYDNIGRKIQTLVQGFKKEGNYEVQYDASMLPSGIYFYQFKAGNTTEVKKMLLLK